MTEKGRVAVELTLQGASQFTRGITMVSGGFGKISDSVNRAAENTFHFMQIGKDLFNLSTRIAGAGIRMANSLLLPNENFEVAQLQFENLLGSADAAREHIEMLYSFANETPFLNPDVLSGGKVLYNIGEAALGAGKGIRMVGDMAAFAEMNFSEMAGVVGRLYTMIASGDAFGEEARRLLELGLLTGEQRNELVDLQKTVDSGVEVWQRFTEMMAKYDGSAKRISDTSRGAKSTIAGLYGEIKRLTGAALFETVKADVIQIRDGLSSAFDSGQVQAFAAAAGNDIARLYDRLKGMTIGDLTVEDIFAAAEQDKLGELLTTIVTGAGKNFGIALYNAAVQYGPPAMRAILPDRMEKLLGFQREAGMQAIAAGDSGGLDQLGLLDKLKFGLGSLNPFETPQAAYGRMMNLGASYGGGAQPMPFLDIPGMIANLGINRNALPGAAAPAVAAAGPSGVGSFGAMNMAQINNLLNSMTVSLDATAQAADRARENVSRLASETVF